MKGFTNWFYRWVDTGPFTYRDLAIYRVVYAVLALLTLPTFQWLNSVPDALYNPPPGPFMLFTGFPSLPVINTVELSLAVALTCLALGLFTRTVSVLVTVLMIVIDGFSFSLGKIDHNILFVLTPLVLSFANWGQAWSLDRRLGRARVTKQEQWPVRLLAFIVGIALFTGSLAKILSGWLSFESQAVLDHLLRRYRGGSSTELLAPFFAGLDFPPFWEALDWATVILEFGLIFCVFSWRAIRIGVASAAVFHLGVLLMLNIEFRANVIAYAAFISWGALVRWKSVSQHTRTRRLPGTAIYLTVALIALVAWGVRLELPAVAAWVSLAIVWVAGVLGGLYLVTQFWKLAQIIMGPPGEPVPQSTAVDRRVRAP